MTIAGVTIAIKALNEETNIARAIESALAAIHQVGGEVLLSDSGSTDRTVEIASRYPVRIAQLSNTDEKCCGAGAQLAFQSARCEFLYLMDADMIVNAAFFDAALRLLMERPDVAGVGGMLREINPHNNQFKILAKSLQSNPDWLPGEVGRLDGGGLYRMSAVRTAGYFGDRNLHAFEEFDLAARLRAIGWKLCRANVPAVDHFSHQVGSYQLLWRRVRSGYSRATGEVLRAALGKPHFGIVIRDLSHVRNATAVLLWMALLIILVVMALFNALYLLPLSFLAVFPIAFLSVRRGSLGLGIYSLATWLVSSQGLVDGFFSRRVDPLVPLIFKIIQEGSVFKVALENSEHDQNVAPSTGGQNKDYEG